MFADVIAFTEPFEIYALRMYSFVFFLLLF